MNSFSGYDWATGLNGKGSGRSLVMNSIGFATKQKGSTVQHLLRCRVGFYKGSRLLDRRLSMTTGLRFISVMNKGSFVSKILWGSGRLEAVIGDFYSSTD